MGIIKAMSENIKKGIRSWLQIQPASPYSIQINEIMDFELAAIRNRIWYRGDGNELEQMYQQSPEYADRYKFWASKCSQGMEMRKIHTGLPSLIVRTLSSIVMADMNDFEFESDTQKKLWDEIDEDNKFRKHLDSSLKEALYIGDGAWKIAFDTEISQYPLLEWCPGERIEIIRSRGRLREVIFKTEYKAGYQRYVLHEHYGYGYVRNRLYRGEEEVPLNAIDATKKFVDTEFDKELILAVPFKIYENAKYSGRGGSIFDGKLDSFDAFDEAWSQWMDALRAGRAKTYIPDCLVPHDPDTGKLIKPNPFDNRYFAADGDMREGQKNQISTEQPAIPHDSYQTTYSTALDLCLQGIISPSTLGIDVKKLDNSEAQREKEKATLYTRDAIINALQDTLPELVSTCINAYNILNKRPIEDVKATVSFGEYANPSFESQVETVSKGKQGGIMSIEASVEELYGDSKDEEWKKEEVARLKAEQGIVEMEEPGLNTEGVNITDEGQSGKADVPDEPQGVSGASGNSKGAGADGNLRIGEG